METMLDNIKQILQSDNEDSLSIQIIVLEETIKNYKGKTIDNILKQLQLVKKERYKKKG